jgi:hypothetical protein
LNDLKRNRAKRHHPRPLVSALHLRIKETLLAHPELTLNEIGDMLGCSRIYVAKVASREGISHPLLNKVKLD